MSRGRLNDLAMLRIEAELAKCIDFQDIINDFDMKKERKSFLLITLTVKCLYFSVFSTTITFEVLVFNLYYSTL